MAINELNMHHFFSQRTAAFEIADGIVSASCRYLKGEFCADDDQPQKTHFS